MGKVRIRSIGKVVYKEGDYMGVLSEFCFNFKKSKYNFSISAPSNQGKKDEKV